MTQNINTWGPYQDVLYSEFYECCADKAVLEIAPMVGHQSMAIAKRTPRKYTLVEPVEFFCQTLEQKYPYYSVINADIFDFYREPYPVDVVVCHGLLYHLHSPLHLLELIANQSDPTFIVLDSVEPTPGHIGHHTEVVNQVGNRQVAKGKRSISLHLLFSFDSYCLAMADLGYKLRHQLPPHSFNVLSKENSWTALFEKTQ